MLELALAAAFLSGAGIGYMLGRMHQRHDAAYRKGLHELVREDRDQWKAMYAGAKSAFLKANSELATIKRQRSDIVRRGNITRRLKREAAGLRECSREGIIG